MAIMCLEPLLRSPLTRMCILGFLIECEAHEDVHRDEPFTPLDPIVVYGRAANLLGNTVSASEGYIGASELAIRPLLRRGELLETVPGLVVTQHSGGGKANQYFARGFNLDHGTDIAISAEGMPVNLRSHAHGQGYADINFVIPELVQSIHFRKGPYHSDVADFSGVGSIQLSFIDTLPRNFAQIELGEHRALRLVTAATHQVEDQFVTGAFELARGDGPWRLPEDLERFNGYVRFGWTHGPAQFRLTALSYVSNWNSTDQIPLRALSAGVVDRFGFVDPSDGGESERHSLSLSALIDQGDGHVHFDTYVIRYRLNLFSNFTYFLEDPIAGDQFNQRDGRLLLGGSLAKSWTLPRGTFQLGAQLRYDDISELGLHRTNSRRRLFSVRDDEVSEFSLGVFAGHHTRWSEWLRTQASMRIDSFGVDVDSDDVRNSGVQHASLASPKLSIALGPWKHFELHANAGYSFHSNDARGTTLRFDPASGEPAAPAVPLARSRGVELGLKSTAAPGLTSGLALWALQSDSELVFVGDAGGTEPAGASRRVGFEWTNYWRPRPWLTIDADLALSRARLRDAGSADRIPNSISRVLSSGISIDSASGWFGALRLRYFGTQPLIEDNSVRAPSSTTVNLRVGRRWWDWDVSIEVLNLFDRDNYDIAYFYESRLANEPEPVEDLHFHPIEPRALRLRVVRNF